MENPRAQTHRDPAPPNGNGAEPLSYSVTRFFAGRSVLLTGATGFVGLNLLEKMLRDLPDLARIYILVRPRSAKPNAAEARLDGEILCSTVFRRLRQEWGPDFEARVHGKVKVVAGDVAKARLGLSEADHARVVDEVSVVISSAATVVFDERLDLALQVNSLGPLRSLELAKRAESAFVHVSTAYVCGKKTGAAAEQVTAIGELPETGPRPELAVASDEADRVRAICDEVEAGVRSRFPDDGGEPLRTELRRALTRAGMERARKLGWNDVYTYTKYLGEQLVRAEHGTTPTTIVRPSIIESSLAEPEPGWLDGLRMTDPIIIGVGKGRIVDFPGRPELALDLIPVDLSTNAILASAAHTGHRPGAFDVLHVASSAKNPLAIQKFYDNLREYFEKSPMLDRDGNPLTVARLTWPSADELKQRLERKLASLKRLGEGVPEGDPARGRLRRQRNELERLLYYVDIYGPYGYLDCRFETTRAETILGRLVPDERERFDFDPTRIDWKRYLQEIHIPGLKRNVLRLDERRPDAAAPVPPPASPLSERLLGLDEDDEVHLRRALAPPLGKHVIQGGYNLFARAFLSSYVRVEAEGLENLPAAGPFILASNHSSHLDTAVIRKVLGRRAAHLHVLAARDYFFDTRFKSWFFSTLFNTVPLDRKARSMKDLALCRRLIGEGRSVLVFPEGTRSRSGELQAFRTGIGVLAVELDCPVVPIHVTGTFECLPRGRTLPRRGSVLLRVGPAAELSDLREACGAAAGGRTSELYRAAAKRIHDSVARLG